MDGGDAQTYAIIGAAMEVHRTLGPGFLEAVYQEALALELAAREIPFNKEAEIDIAYKGQVLDCKYRADFVCFGDVLVELKAVAKLGPIEEAQVIHYLRATGYHRALLINFGEKQLHYRRFVL